jgi:hypothetical protein
VQAPLLADAADRDAKAIFLRRWLKLGPGSSSSVSGMSTVKIPLKPLRWFP